MKYTAAAFVVVFSLMLSLALFIGLENQRHINILLYEQIRMESQLNSTEYLKYQSLKVRYELKREKYLDSINVQ